MTLPAGTLYIPMNQGNKHWIQAVLGKNPFLPRTLRFIRPSHKKPVLQFAPEKIYTLLMGSPVYYQKAQSI